MNQNTLAILEYDRIVDRLKGYCVSNLGKYFCDRMKPLYEKNRVVEALAETTEAMIIVSAGGQPLQGLHDMRETLNMAEKGGILAPADLLRIADMLRGSAKFKRLMLGRRSEMPILWSYAASIQELPGLIQAIETSIDGDGVSDHADDDLKKVRRELRQVESRIQERLDALMASPGLRPAVQDGYVTVKNGRYVIPVKASHRNAVQGVVVSASSSGATVFIEPSSVQNLVDQMVTLRAREEDLVYQVLCALTALVVDYVREIRLNMEVMGQCDFAFAKARLSREMDGTPAEVVDGTALVLRGARHPLLGHDAVPVNVWIGNEFKTLVITGPNTGGKTVLLKTIGLLALMNQSGLHIPVLPGSTMPVFTGVLADIGDRQSIEHSLSTFSSHMENIARILKEAGPGSLVLLDEIGTGTDPREGAALASGILDYLYQKSCITVVTTHYGDLKAYAESHIGFVNGSMEFDKETLKPLYRLQIGRSGESQGLIIAQRLGLPEEVIEVARGYLASATSTPFHTGEPSAVTQVPLDSPTPAAPDALMLGASGQVKLLESQEGLKRTRVLDAPETPGGSEREATPPVRGFLLGDSVYVNPLKDRGIVAREADERGNVIVLVRGKRVSVHRKRLKLLIKREDLYPGDDYDLNIVLLSKKDRKIMRTMERKHTDEVRVVESDPKPRK
jgi:DNA mismatch repair protein MutS2